MVLTSSLGELMLDQMLQYYVWVSKEIYILLNFNKFLRPFPANGFC